MQPVGGYKALKILFNALFVGQAVFIFIAYYVFRQKVSTADPDLQNVLLPVCAIVALGGIILGASVFKSRLQKMNEQQGTLTEKFNQYRAASITKWALMEGPCLFAIISYILTINQLFLLIAGVLLAVFISTAPTSTKVCSHLGITDEELDSI